MPVESGVILLSVPSRDDWFKLYEQVQVLQTRVKLLEEER